MDKINKLLLRTETEQARIYRRAEKDVEDIVFPLLLSIILDDPDATQRCRIQYANKGRKKSKVVKAMTDIMLDANKQSVVLVNDHASSVWDIGYKYIYDHVKAETGIDLWEPTETGMTSRIFQEKAERARLREAILAELNKSIKSGVGRAEVADALIGRINKEKALARTLARTDTTRAVNEGREAACLELWELGIEIWKVWLHMPISKEPRPHHMAMSGEKRRPGKMFPNGGLYPGDPSLPGEERYNCNCRIKPEISNLSTLNNARKLAKTDGVEITVDNIKRYIRMAT